MNGRMALRGSTGLPFILAFVFSIGVDLACSGDGGSGSGGNGGKGTSTAAGGGGASGGSGTSGSGTSGSAGSIGGMEGGTGVPQPTGTIGSGEVPCHVPPGNKCAAGTACCMALPTESCVGSFSDCHCSLTGDCTVMGCDGPDDCPGGVCCALVNNPLIRFPLHVASSCKASCDPQKEEIVCAALSDCPAGATDCRPTGSRFRTCY
jgi:hypothetical protein